LWVVGVGGEFFGEGGGVVRFRPEEGGAGARRSARLAQVLVRPRHQTHLRAHDGRLLVLHRLLDHKLGPLGLLLRHLLGLDGRRVLFAEGELWWWVVVRGVFCGGVLRGFLRGFGWWVLGERER
jgi:hypothetical protein